MPFIPETQKNNVSKGVSSNFKPEPVLTSAPRTSISDTFIEKVPVLRSLSKMGATLGAEIGKQGIGLGQTFLKGSQFLSNKFLGTQRDIYNPLISEADKVKQEIFQKPFEAERETFAGKAGEFVGIAAPFVATGGAVKTGQQFLTGLTKAESIAGSTRVAPYLVQKFAQVAPEAVVSGATEFAVTGGDKDRAKTAAITAGLFTTLSHVGSDVYRQIIPQTVKANILKSLGFTGKVSLKDVANGKKLDDGVGAFTTMSRLAPDIKVVDETGVEKVFDPTKADFIELPQALYQTKKKIYEEYTKLATQSGELGAKFTARDFYTLIDDLKKYDNPGYTSAYSNKANQIISDIQRFVKTGERGQKFFGDTDLLEIQKLVESINKDVNPLSDRAGAEVAQEASQKLRELLDSKIETANGGQYQQLRNAYAQLKSIEPAVINAFKKAARGSKLSDFINGVSAVDVLEGIITQNPSSIVRGGLIKGVKEVIGKINSPEAAMQRAFRLINKGGDDVAGRFTGVISGETSAFKAGQKTQEAIIDYAKNPKLGMSIEDVSKGAYKGEKDLTTKILKDLEGKTTVSKQYILDATNRGELKQVERDLIRDILERETGGNIEKRAFDLRGKLQQETGYRGDKMITLYHGTDAKSAQAIRESGKIGRDAGDITFFTKSAKEAKEYAQNKSKYRGSTPEVIKVEVPAQVVRKGQQSSAGGFEYEVDGILDYKDGIAKHSNENLIKSYGDGTSDTINVSDFAKKVKAELLPLKELEEAIIKEAKVSSRSLEEFIGKVRGSATQYGDYNPALRKYGIGEKSKRVSDLGIDPDMEITVYRGIDDLSGEIKRQISDGDFIIADFDQALSYTGSPKDVVAKKVKIKDLIAQFPDEFARDIKEYGLEETLASTELIYSNSKNPLINLSKEDLTKIWESVNNK